MKDKFINALDEVKAEEQLKQNTYDFLQRKVYAKKNKVTFKRYAAAVISFLIILFAGIFSYNLYFTGTAYIDIDVNPGIELTLNRFNRIIGVYAYNNDGQEVLDAVDIKHMTYKEALNAIIEQMVEMEYIQNTSLFTATLQIANSENETELLDVIKSSLNSVLHGNVESIKKDIFIVNNEIKAHSHEQNLTPAKYLAILELQTYDPAVTIDSCRDHSISDIKQQTHSHMNGGEHGDDDEHESGSDRNHDSSDNIQNTSDTQHENDHDNSNNLEHDDRHD